MPVTGQPLCSFLRAVHRRLILVRWVESVGGGVLAGSAAALPLVAIQLYRHEPAWPAALLLMVVGAMGGMVFALRTWPSRMTAARLADSQLNLADLLSTTVAMQDLQDDPWVVSVRAIADSRCRELSPSQLVLNRWGARAWGGVGLSTALVLAVSLLGSDPHSLQARSDKADERPAAQSRSEVPLDSEVRNSTEVARKQQNPAHSTAPDESGEYASESTLRENAQKLRDGSPHEGQSEGTTGLAHLPQPIRSMNPSSARSTGEISDGQGDGPANTAVGNDGNANAGIGDDASVDVPAWKSASWPEDRARALHAIDDGHIPDAYRDLVREYFLPERP
jgi:hypothetical protein